MIKKILDKLRRKKKEEEAEIDFSFLSLSPNDNIKKEEGNCYFKALNWALSNRKEKNIKNIALTGPYGSGKSSILQSFQRTNTNKDLHFLNISLATFKKEKESEDKAEEENLQRLIELSILQQLFYREKDKILPDSRLKKIKSFRLKELLFTTSGCILFTLSLLYLINSQFIADLLKYPKIININWLHYTALCLCFWGFGLVLFKSIRILYNLKISKLNIKNTEIEISPEINKSVLNHNLEEILYFFEATPYNVVIIEDLDRFRETEIFIKLREVNLLINNSKKVNKEVVFIYAIRDEMFADKDRTKFFDFIIPVIPVINASNSNEIFLKEIKLIDSNVSDVLIDDISLFIDEMRVLFNIINEFQIYKRLLSKELNPDKLLAIIVYKNICPCDFVKLSNYEGDLYDTINKKSDYIKEQRVIIKNKISECQEEIKKLDMLKIKDIKELRSLYILQYIKQINSDYKISDFIINNRSYDFNQVLEDDIFHNLIENTTVYFMNTYYNRSYNQIINFKTIEKQVDSTNNYKEREQQIEDWNNNKVKELKEKILWLEQEKSELQQAKISKLLSNNNVIIEANDNKQKLIKTLLRNGYIAEDYLDYISLFHEGSLSKNDFIFLLNVKSQTNTDFNHNLDKIENLIKKIHINDFGKEYILNHKLIDFILTKDVYEEQLKAIFKFLKNESKASIKFINEFIHKGMDINTFIKVLCYNWSNIWHYLYQQSNYLEDDLNYYFKLIISNANIINIKEISEKSNLRQYISQKKDFCNIITDKEKIIEILEKLDIKFEDLNKSETPDDLFEYIYQNNHYQINSLIIKEIIRSKGYFNQVDFDFQNYYAIRNSNCDILIKYIENNIDYYITNVYLRLEMNIKENEECLIELLNNNKLTENDKKAIIEKVETKITDLSKIDSTEIENILLQNSKVKPIWKNLIDNFINAEQKMSEFVVAFLNDKDNAELLSKIKIEKDKPDEETIKNFFVSLLLKEDINNYSYALILNSIPYIYFSLNFESLSKEKVKLLIDNNKLELTEENYLKLVENFDNLHILLIEKRHFKLSEVINDLAFSENDICALLKSSVLLFKEKESILKRHGDTDIIANLNILNFIGDILLQQNTLNISNEVKKAILTQSKLKIDDKILLFNNLNSIFDNDDITEILQSFPELYSDITKNDVVSSLPQNALNANLVRILKDKKYIINFKSSKKGIIIEKLPA